MNISTKTILLLGAFQVILLTAGLIFFLYLKKTGAFSFERAHQYDHFLAKNVSAFF